VSAPLSVDVVCTADGDNVDYLKLWLTPKGGGPMVFRLSIGAAEVLAAEIQGSIQQQRGDQ
jgi:hypothetical protein